MTNVQESSRGFARHLFPMAAIPDGIGSVVAGERSRRRWSQARLAVRSGLSRASIYRLETGVRPSRADTLFRIAHALDLEIRHLVPDWPEWDPIGSDGEGSVLRERRRAIGMTLAELAKAAGVSEATVSRHEREVCVNPMLGRRLRAFVSVRGDPLETEASSVDAGAAGAGSVMLKH